MTLRSEPPRRPSGVNEEDPETWPVDRGRPLGLRLLALLGAFSFLMLGVSSLVPLLRPPPPPPMPDQRDGPIT
jgi:hypothetical protein